MHYEILSRLAQAEVHETLAALPRELCQKVDAVPVFLEACPDADDVASGVEPDTLGYFDEGSPEAPTPRIRLWLENIWDYADGDEEIFREEVHTTLLHEIGHLLGWGEEEIEERGLG
jgi:predicted Zn-dependent protease with MMP-like domain